MTSNPPAAIHHPPPSGNADVLIRVKGVSKKFCRSLKKSLWYGLCDAAYELNPFSRGNIELRGSTDADASFPSAQEPPLRPGEFWAVKNVSFELRRGECLGLIGHNGAGKTTLLRMLNGLIKPDTGRIEMRGRVGALIALGAGFNPILTGRENIYVNASILGLSKREIDEKLDEIIDFAEIGDFIDAPVQSYSSGMQVRLGFAVATALEPDILILDEVLAVGDAAFRAKCYKRVGDLLDRCAVIFVSHFMDLIRRLCSSAILLDHGRCLGSGDLSTVAQMYETRMSEQAQTGFVGSFCKVNQPVEAFNVCIDPPACHFKESLRCEVELVLNASFHGGLRFQLYSSFGHVVAENDDLPVSFPEAGRFRLILMCGPLNLRPGNYRASVILVSANGLTIQAWSYQEAAVTLQGEVSSGNEHILPVNFSIKNLTNILT